MCTSVCYRNNTSYFGRNLDLDRAFGERVVVTPRNFEIKMRCVESVKSHYAMIGMACVVNDFPLYFDATNEKGLSMAALNFPENATYYDFAKEKDNVAPFELILWILGRCASIEEAKWLMSKINLVNINFSNELPLSPLHWMISDKERSIVLEPLSDGLKIHDNPFEILTNNPPFEFHKINASNYMGLSTDRAKSKFKDNIPLKNYSFGMGAIGLPGDFSSASRFVRALFVKENSVSEKDEKSNVNQFFHILNAVAMPKGCVLVNQEFEYTRYSSCCNIERGIYYYITYDDFNIQTVDMRKTDLDAKNLWCYDAIDK